MFAKYIYIWDTRQHEARIKKVRVEKKIEIEKLIEILKKIIKPIKNIKKE